MITQNTIFGESKGVLGGAVALRRYGKNIVRAKALSVRDANTNLQKPVRAAFLLVQMLMSTCLPIIRTGFKGYAVTRSAFASAMSENILSGITGTYPNQLIDWTTIEFGKGTLQSCEDFAATHAVAGAVICTHVQNPLDPTSDAGDYEDYVVRHVATNEVICYPAFTTRGAAGNKTRTLLVPDEWGTSPVMVFLGFHSVLNKAGAELANKVKRATTI